MKTPTPSFPPSPYFVASWESGWWVERADDKDTEKSSRVRGPFKDEESAIRAMHEAEAVRRRRLERKHA